MGFFSVFDFSVGRNWESDPLFSVSSVSQFLKMQVLLAVFVEYAGGILYFGYSTAMFCLRDN